MAREGATYGGELAIGHNDHTIEEALFARRAVRLVEPEGEAEGVDVAVAVSRISAMLSIVPMHEAYISATSAEGCTPRETPKLPKRGFFHNLPPNTTAQPENPCSLWREPSVQMRRSGFRGMMVVVVCV